jgi:uncharacterized protein YcbK (DUF882 family)
MFSISCKFRKVIRNAEEETRGTQFNKSVQMSSYADDIVIIGCSLAVVKKIVINMEKAVRKWDNNK